MVTETEEIVHAVIFLLSIGILSMYVYYYVMFKEWSKAVVRTASFILLRPKETVTQSNRYPTHGNYIVEVVCKEGPRQGYFIRLEFNVDPRLLTNQLTFLYWLVYYIRNNFLGFADFKIRDYEIYRFPHPDYEDGISTALFRKCCSIFKW